MENDQQPSIDWITKLGVGQYIRLPIDYYLNIVRKVFITIIDEVDKCCGSHLTKDFNVSIKESPENPFKHFAKTSNRDNEDVEHIFDVLPYFGDAAKGIVKNSPTIIDLHINVDTLETS